MIKIASLWKRKGPKGDFLAGRMGESSIMIFPNKSKKDPKHPDFNVFVAEDKREKQADGQVPNRAPQKPAPPPQEDDGFNFD